VAHLNELWEMDPVEPKRTNQQPPRPKGHPRLRMRQLVFDSAQDGVGPTVVHRILDKEGYPTSYQTVLGLDEGRRRRGGSVATGRDRTPYFPGPNIGDPYEGGPTP
jgi:hypothetical protein